MDFKTLLFQVLSLFIMMGVGLLARKLKFITDETKRGMTDILIKIITPAVVISSFSGEFDSTKISNAFIVLAGAVVAHTLLCLTCLLLYKKETPDRKAVLRFTLIFGNFGFMGFPVLQSLYGIDGVFYGAMFTAAFYLFSWTFGVSLFTKSTSMKDKIKSIFNVPFIAVVIGVIMYVSPFRLPAFLQSPIDAIGSMNTPFSMLIVGSIFADVNFKEIFTDIKVYIASLLRILVVPVGLILLVWLVNQTNLVSLHGIPYRIVLTEEAMPCAAYAAIFATKFGSDAKLASKIVAIATALSIITIPFVVYLMELLGI